MKGSANGNGEMVWEGVPSNFTCSLELRDVVTAKSDCIRPRQDGQRALRRRLLPGVYAI